MKKGLAARYAQSVRFTVVAWTLTSTSFACGDRRFDLADPNDVGCAVPGVHRCPHEPNASQSQTNTCP